MQRSNGIPACASCKHQRKKCTENCILAPLFPANRTQEFEAVHKVFGVSNVTKIVKNLKEEDRKSAADSLIWEALCRQKDPVLGPLGEYKKLYDELKLYKSQYQQIHQVQPQAFLGWNDNKGMNFGVGHNNNDSLNYIRQSGNFSVDSCNGFPSNHVQNLENIMQERENGSLVLLPQQQSVQGFNQQYYLSEYAFSLKPK